MTTDQSPMQRLQDVAAKLSVISRKNSYDPYELFEWPDSLPTTGYWMAPELMTCYGTPVWSELTEQQRLSLSHWESVNFFSLNVHLIRELIGEVADRIYETRFPGLSDFFHDFISEENKHMWFFATFCLRYGGKVYPSGKMFSPANTTENVLQDVMVFGRILIAEELCDAFNMRMAEDTRLPALVQQINLVHHRDEARHIAFGLADDAEPERSGGLDSRRGRAADRRRLSCPVHVCLSAVLLQPGYVRRRRDRKRTAFAGTPARRPGSQADPS